MIDLSVVEQQVSRAARENTHQSTDELFRIMQGHEVFFRIKTETVINQKTGRPEQRSVSSPLLSLPNGLNAFVVYTSKENKALPSPFGGAPWERALQIMVAMEQADGLLLVNQTGDTVAWSKEAARGLVNESVLKTRRLVGSPS